MKKREIVIKNMVEEAVLVYLIIYGLGEWRLERKEFRKVGWVVVDHRRVVESGLQSDIEWLWRRLLWIGR